MMEWIEKAAEQIHDELTKDSYSTTAGRMAAIIESCRPTDGPLLLCIDCKNSESPAGALGRHFNRGRCVHCGGSFKVIRA